MYNRIINVIQWRGWKLFLLCLRAQKNWTFNKIERCEPRDLLKEVLIHRTSNSAMEFLVKGSCWVHELIRVFLGVSELPELINQILEGTLNHMLQCSLSRLPNYCDMLISFSKTSCLRHCRIQSTKHRLQVQPYKIAVVLHSSCLATAFWLTEYSSVLCTEHWGHERIRKVRQCHNVSHQSQCLLLEVCKECILSLNISNRVI